MRCVLRLRDAMICRGNEDVVRAIRFLNTWSGAPSAPSLGIWACFGLCILVSMLRAASAAPSDPPPLDLLFLQYGQVASQVRNSRIQFVTREASRGSLDGDEQVLIKCCELFLFGDEAQIRISWSNHDQPDWRAKCTFDQLGDTPAFNIEGAERVVCFRSKDLATAEFVNVPPGRPYSVLMALYRSERELAPFFLPYVAENRRWNHGGKFEVAGHSLVDEFFRHGVKQLGEPRLASLDGQERWRADLSISGQRVPLAVRPRYGKLDGEDILSAWFETQPPYRLRTITKERRFFHNDAEVLVKFTGEPWWEERVDLSGYDRSPSGFTVAMDGRETISIDVHPFETFDNVAAAIKDGVLTLNSEHFVSLDRTWSVKQLKRIESAEGIWIEPSPGTLIHDVNAGTQVIFGKSPEESAAILGYDADLKSTNPPIPTAGTGPRKIALVAVNLVALAGLFWWYVKTRRNS